MKVEEMGKNMQRSRPTALNHLPRSSRKTMTNCWSVPTESSATCTASSSSPTVNEATWSHPHTEVTINRGSNMWTGNLYLILTTVFLKVMQV